MHHPKYCSISSIDSEERIFGTASRLKSILLLEYREAWRKEALAESRIDEEIKVFLKKKVEEHIFSKVLLIRKNNITEGKLNVFAVNNQEESPFLNHLQINDYRDLLVLDYNKLFGEISVENRNESIYLVCTNGKKDKCCSKFGLPIYHELVRLGQNVWQCSHVGGDRFAPNIFHLPYSHLYGHLEPTELKAFCLTTNKGKIYINKYRGISCYNAKQQVADYFLRKELNDFDFTALRLVDNNPKEENSFSSLFYHPRSKKYYEVLTRSKKSSEKYFLTCKAIEQKPINIYDLVEISEKSI